VMFIGTIALRSKRGGWREGERRLATHSGWSACPMGGSKPGAEVSKVVAGRWRSCWLQSKAGFRHRGFIDYRPTDGAGLKVTVSSASTILECACIT
jgi:hypothetical protein